MRALLVRLRNRRDRFAAIAAEMDNFLRNDISKSQTSKPALSKKLEHRMEKRLFLLRAA
jgi:hypothetical protein